MIVEATATGVGRHFFELVGGLLDRGHKIRVLYSPRREDVTFRWNRERLQDRIEFTPLSMQAAPSPSDFRAVAAAVRLARDVDLIHGHSSKGGMIARLAGVFAGKPSVYTAHGISTQDPDLPGWKRAFLETAERSLSMLGNAVIAVSLGEMLHMAAYGMRRLYLVENGVAGASARPRADVRAALELADDVPVVGFVGRLHRHKGYDVLMEAWPKVLAAVPDARLAVIGDGELGPAEGPNVIPLRFVNGPDWLAGFDVLAVPSRCDTLSYALLEAAVAGVPTAATEVGGVNELVGAVDPSLIVPIEDVDGMARNIVRLLKDPGYRQRIGKALEIRARHFTVNRMVDGTVGVYRDVLAKAAG